jgi:hypothetical protein
MDTDTSGSPGDGRLTNPALGSGTLGEREIVESESAPRQSNEDVSEAELNLLAGIRDLVARSMGGPGALSERLTLVLRQLGIEGFEVHADSLPEGNAKSTPLGKLPSGNLPAMDVFARRVVNLRKLLKTISAADLSRESRVAASYISRALLPPEDKNHKRIGEITARKLERGGKKPEGWLDRLEGAPAPGVPAPPPVNERFQDRHEVTPSDWALLQDIKDAMASPRLAQKIAEVRTELSELREFAANVYKPRNERDL